MSVEPAIQPTNGFVKTRKRDIHRAHKPTKTPQEQPGVPKNAAASSNGVKLPKPAMPVENTTSVQFGSLQATQRPPAARRQGPGKSRKGKMQVFYPSIYPMGYPMLPNQAMCPQMQGWFPGMPPHMAMSQHAGYPPYHPPTAPGTSTSQPSTYPVSSETSQMHNGIKTTSMPVEFGQKFAPFVPGQTIGQVSESGEDKPLFKLPVKKVIRIVNPNDVKKPESQECMGNAEKAGDSTAAVKTQKNEENSSAEPVKQEVAGSEPVRQEIPESEPVKEEIPEFEPVKQEISEPAKTLSANSDSLKPAAEHVDNPLKAKAPVSMNIPKENVTTTHLPTVLECTKEPDASENVSKEPPESNPKPAKCNVLEPHEVVAKYATTETSPKIVDEILKYPSEFMMQFAEKCNTPEDFNLECITTWSMILERSSSGMHRSASTHARQSVDPAAEFGRMGQFRRSNTDSGKPDWTDRNAWRSSNRMDKSTSGRRFERNGERSSRQGRNARHGAGGLRNEPLHTEALANVKPLVKSTTGFVPRALRKDNVVEDEMDEKVYRRRILVLLNKLTPDNFDVVSDEMVAWGDKSAQQTDGSVLRALVELVVEKASDEPKWMKMYGNLCLKLIHKTSNDVKDHQVRLKSGEFMAGGMLVRKYLLHKCQNDFERGWKVESTAVEQTDAFYEAVKIKRRGLGLVELIGELFLLDVLTTDIIKSCLRRLLSNVKDSQEETLESMMKLLETVGQKLDVPSNKEEVNLYFSRIRLMTTNMSLDSRIRLLLMNMIDLRSRNWKLRNPTDAPTTINELHQQLEQEKASKRSDPKKHIEHRNWQNSAGRNAETRVGDLSRFGNLSRTNQRPAGNGASPFSALAGGSRGWKSNSRADTARPPALNSRASSHSGSSGMSTPDTASSQNMFNALLSEEEEEEEEEDSKPQSSKEPVGGDTKEQIKKAVSQLVATDEHMELKQVFGTAEHQKAFYLLIDCAMDCRPDNLELVVHHVNQLARDGVIMENPAISALAEFSEQLEDLVLDVPNALRFFGMLMAACVSLPRVHEALGKLATKLDSSRPPASIIVFAYLKQLLKFNGLDETQRGIEEAEFDVTQFMCADRRADDDVKRALQFQDLLELFPRYR
ncbi:hypothetical protein LPJ78_004238 [Coemansia sp. RSA 989]|nr:hypothetical protein LPJ78_004238 [Coemansia sp. RSA 989]